MKDLIKEHLAKIERCILSVENEKQLSSCLNMIMNFEHRFNEVKSCDRTNFLEAYSFMSGLRKGRAQEFCPKQKYHTYFS